MRLTSIHVRQFKNILDSTEVKVEHDVTCLVGKNESGKTALLQALYRLKPAHAASFNDLDDYPRWLLSEHRRTGEVTKARPIRAVFELEPADIGTIDTTFGRGVLPDSKSVALSKDYTGKTVYVEQGVVVEAPAVAKLLAGIQLPEGLAQSVGKPKTLDELKKKLDAIEKEIPTMDATLQGGVTQGIAQVRGAISAQFPQGITYAVQERILKLEPTFFYFSEYSQLVGKIDLELLFSGGQLDESQETAKSLLRLAHADDKSMLAQNYEQRKAELEAVANRLTQEVSKYWSQSQDLSVHMDIEMAPGPTQGTMVAKWLHIRVEDRRHGFTGPFDQRSSGFRWFFSFLAAFHDFENRKERVVILLDEPALTLHAKAQNDFLRFINERLVPQHQVIYTTHSPFMVEAGQLDRVRTVEDRGREAGAVVAEDVLSIDPDTLFPLQAALGYDIAQALLIGPDNLLVEGTSDYTYLVVLSDFLKEAKRAFLNPRWRILPAGGASNIPTFVALLGQKLPVTVLVDTGSGTQKVNDLAKAGYLKPKRLITVAEVTGTGKADVEDLFDVDDYLKLYNASEGKNLTHAGLQPGDRILDRIQRTEGDFDHGRPAEFLLRNRDQLLPQLQPVTLDRFEVLIERINATL